MSQCETPRLELSGITKSFLGCLANDDVELAVFPGEIHALLGENGAGKSTLVKIIYGLLQADEGVMRWNGQLVQVSDPRAARALGIGVVFQHFSLFEALTVAENIALAIPGVLDLNQISHKILEISQKYGLSLSPNSFVSELSVGERQRVEIVRCLIQSPSLIVMDEPTSVLTPQEVEGVLRTLKRLSSEGVSILYISHKLQEIRRLCHRATVMRDGKVVSEVDPQAHTVNELARLMVGSELTDPQRSNPVDQLETVLAVSNLCLEGQASQGIGLKNIDISLKSGEIFGIAGIAGNGQAELLSRLSGDELVAPKTIRLKGEMVGGLGVSQRRARGLSFVPEERLGRAAVPELSLSENVFLSAHRRCGLLDPVLGLMRKSKTKALANKVCELFNVRHNGTDGSAAGLSGGNLQKLIVGREILQNPTVLLASQPTWGVDAGSAATVHQSMLDLADSGVALLIISQDLDEIFSLADRIAVLSDGRLSKAFFRDQVDREYIGLLMGEVPQKELKAAHV